ncbi:hypothetical protein F5B20DRAFT_576411 [Whalleya microplaca]|nr:hypothetical protein F5B20DRAFT_576411 [Whalleya microplaca]
MPHNAPTVQPNGSSKPKFSYGKQLDVFLTTAKEPESSTEEGLDWLTVAEKRIQQDLETSKKELELIKYAIEEADTYSIAEKKPSGKRRDQELLLGACQEYSSSQCQILKERLRQVQFWSASRQMGRKIPEKEPAEWRVADLEWRQWLSEQAAARADKSDQTLAEHPLDLDDDIAWGIWGPLAHILTVYTSHETNNR